MGLDRYLSEKDGIFASAANLQTSSPALNAIVGTSIGGVLTLYAVNETDLGSGLILANGRYANPTTADAQTAINTADIATNTGNIATNTANIASISDTAKWEPSKTANFTVEAGEKYLVDASGGAVDGHLKTAYVVGDTLIVHNESISTNMVRLTNTALTLKGPKGTVTPSDDLVLLPGDTAHFAMKTTTIGEAV